MLRLPALVAVTCVTGLGISTAACVWVFNRVDVEEVDTNNQPVTVESAVKAHLVDGSIVMYPDGVTIYDHTVFGHGERYGLRAGRAGALDRVPLDSIAAMESFFGDVEAGKSAAVSIFATVGGVALALGITVAIACAIDPKCFGSCPTFYSDSAGSHRLEAEAFSYSIAPLFETRDVDRLRATPNATGELRLEGRNEALETHYLNHLELLEVRHDSDELVLPDQHGRPLAVRDFRAVSSAADGAGREVRELLLASDDSAYASDVHLLESARIDQMRDRIDLALPTIPGADSVAVVMRVRNSLLATVLLYERMLAEQGARSLDWIGRDLQRIGPAVDLGRWYVEHLGMRIAAEESGEFRDVAWIKDSGPVAWKDIAVVIPAPAGDSLRIRLDFTVDNWRIDRVAIAADYRRPPARAIPVARIIWPDSTERPDARERLSEPDENYLITRAGQRFELVFDVGRAPAADMSRTFLLASQGYYVEWIRRAWLESPSLGAFTPSDSTLLLTIERYRTIRDPLEERFRSTLVPVR